MPKLSKSSTTATDIGVGQVYEHMTEEHEIAILEMREDVDGAPLLRGLPDDKCTCPHWGYVMKGKLTFTFADHVEHFEAGDGFYVPPGHTPAFAAGTECLMFSPADKIAAVNEAIERNLAELQSA